MPTCRKRIEDQMMKDELMKHRISERNIRLKGPQTDEERVEEAEPVATNLRVEVSDIPIK